MTNRFLGESVVVSLASSRRRQSLTYSWYFWTPADHLEERQGDSPSFSTGKNRIKTTNRGNKPDSSDSCEIKPRSNRMTSGREFSENAPGKIAAFGLETGHGVEQDRHATLEPKAQHKSGAKDSVRSFSDPNVIWNNWEHESLASRCQGNGSSWNKIGMNSSKMLALTLERREQNAWIRSSIQRAESTLLRRSYVLRMFLPSHPNFDVRSIYRRCANRNLADFRSDPFISGAAVRRSERTLLSGKIVETRVDPAFEGSSIVFYPWRRWSH